MKSFLYFTTVTLAITLSSCASSIYKTYEKYEEDARFSQVSISQSILEALNGLSTLLGREQTQVTDLISKTQSLDLIRYQKDLTQKKGPNFERDLRRMFRKIGYREVLKAKAQETGLQFYAKGTLNKVKEFHIVSHSASQINILSIKGAFYTNQLEKIYKEAKEKGYIDKLFNEIKELKKRQKTI